MTQTVERRPAGADEVEGGAAEEQRPRRRLLLVLVPLLATIALIGFAVARVMAEEPAPVPETTTTTVRPTTTTTEPAVDPWLATAARARPDLPAVEVFREPPDPAFRPVAAEVRRAEKVRAFLPPYNPQDNPEYPPLPRDDLPIEGRLATENGWAFENPTPFGSPLVFLVTEQHGDWMKVMIPVRPNGAEGWVRTTDVVLETPTRYRIRIDLGERKLRLFDGEELQLETGIVIGAEKSPTPPGRYFISDRVEKYTGSAYGPWILPVNGYSELMNRFADGVPVIALHGTNAPELIGQARSNGCIRMPNEVITELKNRLPLGTPVDVWT